MLTKTGWISGGVAVALGLLLGFMQIFNVSIDLNNVAFVTQSVDNWLMQQTTVSDKIGCKTNASVSGVIPNASIGVSIQATVNDMPSILSLGYRFYSQGRIVSSDNNFTLVIDANGLANQSNIPAWNYTINAALLSPDGVIINCESVVITV